MSELSFSIFPNENFVDLRLYQFGFEQCKPLQSFGPFVRNHYLFHYVLSGRGRLDAAADDGTLHHYNIEAGQGFLICAGKVNTYCADSQEPWKYVWLEFDGLRAAEYINAAGLGPGQPVYSPNGLAAQYRVGDIMMYIARHQEQSPLHLVGFLCLFLDALVQTSQTHRDTKWSPLKDFYIQEAVHFMEENYQRDITVEEVAGICRLNRNYFSKLFKEKMGCPPQEFLIRMRLSKSTELMRSSAAPIGEIASRCGYPNQLHFSRAFRKRYGMSPREWRSLNAAPIQKN